MANNQVQPGVAAVLSAFWTGLGQIYCGSIGRGLAIMFIGPTIMVAFFFLMVAGAVTNAQSADQAAGGVGAAYILLLVGGFAYWIFNIYDAYSLATTMNRGSRGSSRGGRRRRRSKSDDGGRRRSRRSDNDVSDDSKPRRRSKLGRKSRPVSRSRRSRY